MEIKYTTDGRKVVIVGSLNSQEKIVQEVFIVNGNEIPSGENFVVKSLHDAPAISWKEKNIKDIEKNYDSTVKKYNDELTRLRLIYDKQRTLFREKANYIMSALKNANEKSFELLVDYITGEIKFVVITSSLEILPITEFNETYDERLRLISIFGKDNGSFTYAQGQYYDSSGYSQVKLMPCKTYEEAINHVKELLPTKTITKELIAIVEKYGLSLPPERIQEYKEKTIEVYQKNIDHYMKSVNQWQDGIKSLS